MRPLNEVTLHDSIIKCCDFPGLKICVLSRKMSDVDKNFRKVQEYIDDSWRKHRLKRIMPATNMSFIEFDNGSEIQFMSENEPYFRGHRFNLIIADEFVSQKCLDEINIYGIERINAIL